MAQSFLISLLNVKLNTNVDVDYFAYEQCSFPRSIRFECSRTGSHPRQTSHTHRSSGMGSSNRDSLQTCWWEQAVIAASKCQRLSAISGEVFPFPQGPTDVPTGKFNFRKLTACGASASDHHLISLTHFFLPLKWLPVPILCVQQLGKIKHWSIFLPHQPKIRGWIRYSQACSCSDAF